MRRLDLTALTNSLGGAARDNTRISPDGEPILPRGRNGENDVPLMARVAYLRSDTAMEVREGMADTAGQTTPAVIDKQDAKRRKDTPDS